MEELGTDWRGCNCINFWLRFGIPLEVFGDGPVRLEDPCYGIDMSCELQVSWTHGLTRPGGSNQTGGAALWRYRDCWTGCSRRRRGLIEYIELLPNPLGGYLSEPFINKIRLAPKAAPKLFRLVVNCLPVNSYVEHLSPQYEDLRVILANSAAGNYSVTWDLREGYFHFLIHPESRRWLGFRWRDMYFRYRVLPLAFRKLHGSSRTALRAALPAGQLIAFHHGRGQRPGEAAASCSDCFSSHSLRIGGDTAMAAAGFDMATIKAVGDWNSDVVLRYVRAMAAASAGASSRMGF